MKRNRVITLETIVAEIESLVKQLNLDPDNMIKQVDLANSKFTLDALIDKIHRSSIAL